MNLLLPTVVYYCILLYSALSRKKSSMHAYIYKYNSVCLCVCVCVLDVHARVGMCICMYVCGSYNTQNGMEPIGGLLYFNYLSSFLFATLTVLLMVTPS